MGANIAGIYGAQIFREDDKPRYRRAFAIACGVLAFGLLIAIIRYIDDRITMRKAKRLGAVQGVRSEVSSGSESVEEKSSPVPPAEDQPIPVIGTKVSV